MGGPVAVAVVAAAMVAVVVVVDPNEPGHYPTCPVAAATDLLCPGCGTLRAVHALGHGDLAAALGANALTVAVLPYLAWRWWRWTRRRVVGSGSARLAHPAYGWTFLALVGVFTVLRNTPWGAALAP